MMWWGKKEEDPESASKKSKKTPNRRRLGRPSPYVVAAEPRPLQEPTTAPSVFVAETVSGIEVSFSDEIRPTGKKEGMLISLQEQLARRRKIHRAQFRTGSHHPNNTAAVGGILPNNNFSVGKHRVALFGAGNKKSGSCQTKGPTHPHKYQTNYQDALFLLQSHEIRDEASCVQEEIVKLSHEIQALEVDHVKLVQRSAAAISAAPAPPFSSSSALSTQWDIHRLLATEKLGGNERTQLQEHRGLCLTVSLHNQQAREAFLSKCGTTASAIRAQHHNRNHHHHPLNNNVLQIRPETCRDGGAAAAIQHVSLLSGLSASESAFFISRDKGKSYYWGHLPDRLFRRMKNAGLDPKYHACDLIYLSTGPMGSYYAEFRSGECWWGSTAEDTEFDAICSDWDVYRVVFGSGSFLVDANGHKHVITSWIILGRDGRAAWKNLPGRLHCKLERRLASEAAPAEVALGTGSSYFIRFLDGTTDYCLPAAAAHLCRSIEASGITSMAMHPDLSHDFVIRHC